MNDDTVEYMEILWRSLEEWRSIVVVSFEVSKILLSSMTVSFILWNVVFADETIVSSLSSIISVW